MKNKKIIILYLLTIINTKIKCDDIITFFFKQFPTFIKEERMRTDGDNAIKRINKFGQPKKLADYTLRAASSNYLTTGIFCIYEGFITASDLNGQIIFPRRQNDPKVTIVVSKSITPIIMIENTVHHWKISNPKTAKMFELERKTDKFTKTSFWETKEVEIPNDRIIPEYSITIIANPKHIFIPTGIKPTAKDNQLVLPDIYVKPSIEKVQDALHIFSVKNFMAPNETVYKKDKMSYSQQLRDIK